LSFIDVQTDISANQIAAIRRQLQEICVMYFMIYIGKVVAITAAGFVIDTDTIDGTKITDFNIPVGNYFKIQYAIN
jgi:fructose-1,6-bisphosphatase